MRRTPRPAAHSPRPPGPQYSSRVSADRRRLAQRRKRNETPSFGCVGGRDRPGSNAGVDIFSGASQTFLGRAPGFTGQQATTSVSGPDGVLTVTTGGVTTLYAGDGNSTLKVFNATNRAGAVRVARFVCSDSSAAAANGGTSGSNAPTLSCCSEDPAAATRLGSYGGNSLLRRNTAGARSPRSGAPLFPRNPKAGPSFPCAWAFGDRRWRGRRQVAIGPPGLFGLVRRNDLGA
jgi:hypothetical protein